MALPAGVTTANLTVGAPVSFSGLPIRSSVQIVPSAFLVHSATGIPLVNLIEETATLESVVGQFTLPHTDQAGFQDENGNAYTNWYYTATINYSTDRGPVGKPLNKVFQLPSGQTVVDLDLLPGGAPAMAYSAPVATVTSVAGLTGAITGSQIISAPEVQTELSATILTATADKLDKADAAAPFKAAAAGLPGSRKPSNLRLGVRTFTASSTAHAAFPGMAVCKDGSYLVVWRQAESHEPVHHGVIKARKYSANGTPLTAEYTVLSDALDLRDPMLTVLENGDIVMQYFKHDSTATTIAGVWVAKSTDNGATFTVLSKVPFTWDSLAACAGKVAVAPNGDWLVTAYGRTSATFNHIRLMRSTNQGVSWTGEITVAEGQAESRNYVEPVIGTRPDGSLMCLIRVSDSNGTNPAIYSTTSTDNGLTWTAETSIIAGAGGRPAWISLASGGILLVNRLVGSGNVMQFRTSWDNGATWTTATQIGKTPISQGTYAQPVEVAPGLVAVAWGIEDNSASSSTITWGYIADGSGWSPAGDDFLTSAAAYPSDVALADTFQRADSATLGTAETGQTWTTVTGGIGITSNLAQINTGAGTSLAIVDAGIANGSIECAWRYAGASSGNGMILRWIDSSNYLFTAIESAGGTLKLYKYDAGALTALATVTGIGMTGDAWHQVKVTMRGSVITVSINGVQKINHSLSAANQTKYGNATVIGLRATLDGVKFGNLVAKRSFLELPTLV